MKLIAVTPELPHPHEIEYIITILDAGFDYVHLRKPDYTMPQLRTLIEEIPSKYHCRLKLHNHFLLAKEYDISGLHLNRRVHDVPQELSHELKLSRSCHAAIELKDLNRYEYVLLSPIFDSISKRGYKSRFSQGDLTEIFKRPETNGKIIALGGIMPTYLQQLSNLGFAGAAFLGYLFNSNTTSDLTTKLTTIQNIIQCYNL